MALQNNKALQFRPGYVACSFTFLLLGLASLSSSINLLVLRFMILSLEEEEEEEELQVRVGEILTTYLLKKLPFYGFHINSNYRSSTGWVSVIFTPPHKICTPLK